MENDERYAQANFNVSLLGDNFIHFVPMKVIDKDRTLGSPSAGGSISIRNDEIRVETWGEGGHIYSMPWDHLVLLVKAHGKKIM